jgi:hypothetical protein
MDRDNGVVQVKVGWQLRVLLNRHRAEAQSLYRLPEYFGQFAPLGADLRLGHLQAPSRT